MIDYKEPSVAVVYIARGAGAGGPSAVGAFLEAFRNNPPEFPHRLVILAKGWDYVQGLPNLINQAQLLGAHLEILPDDGFDWGAYMRIAPNLKERFICLLNTHSCPLVPGWLAIMMKNILQPGVGAVGATGSWGTISGVWPLFEADTISLLMYPLRLFIEFIRVCRNISEFPAMPNPHLRSNALLVPRDIFVSFCKGRKIPRNKRDAHLLESGRNGFTSYLRSSNLQVLIVNSTGAAYTPEMWINSGTFRQDLQLNLLVSDNQTRLYQSAGLKLKRRLENAAWGKALTNSI